MFFFKPRNHTAEKPSLTTEMQMENGLPKVPLQVDGTIGFHFDFVSKEPQRKWGRSSESTSKRHH